MNTKDKTYLKAQFWNKVFKKNFTEYQTFFEDIIQKVEPDFKKVRPYGKRGDGGNDGYVHSKGKFFQVYAPLNPEEKDADAAKKLVDDFNWLKDNWDQITTIKEFTFVFNDKDRGTTVVLEEALAKLQQENEDITFDMLRATDLEKLFLTLDSDQIHELGFDIDSRNSITFVNEYLDEVEKDLDKDNPGLADQSLKKIQNAVSQLNTDDLTTRYELLMALTLQKEEDFTSATSIYESLIKRYPTDPTPLLYHAEIKLNNGEADQNKSLLEKAEKIQKDFWLLKVEIAIRNLNISPEAHGKVIEKKEIPDDKRIEAIIYRVNAFICEENSKPQEADAYIEKAKKLLPDRYANYDTHLALIFKRMFSFKQNSPEEIKAANDYLAESEEVEKMIKLWGGVGHRNNAALLFRKHLAHEILDNPYEHHDTAKQCFENILKCYFDNSSDKMLTALLIHIHLPKDKFEQLKKYIVEAKKKPSIELCKILVIQFNYNESLFSDGEGFFNQLSIDEISAFIKNLKKEDQGKTLKYLLKDVPFALTFAATFSDSPELRKKIIEGLPNDSNLPIDRLQILLNYDSGDKDRAFEIAKKIDFSHLRYHESVFILKLALEKKAWDLVILLVNKVLVHEKVLTNKLDLKLRLFTAQFNLEMYKDVVMLGRSILSNESEKRLLSNENLEQLLQQTIFASVSRGEFPDALKSFEDNADIAKSWNFILGVKTEVYIKNQLPEKALDAIVEGICLIQSPSPEQYARLMLFFTEIGNMSTLDLASDELVKFNNFVKLSNQDEWFFIGYGNGLDAIKVNNTDKQKDFLDKKVGQTVVLGSKYQEGKNTSTIEQILPIEKYIFWQCRHYVQQLTITDSWDAVKMISVPEKNGSVDLTYLKDFMEDSRKEGQEFRKIYSEKDMPLAFLAINEGGLLKAIGAIVVEEIGYIRNSSGNPMELNEQKDIAKTIIAGSEFYLDGTSALFLAESGLFKDIYQFIPNVKVPQTVITLLLQVKEKFTYSPGKRGNMWYSKGNIGISEINETKRQRILDNIEKTIEYLESKPSNISVISEATKSNCFSETKVPDYLVDACVLAQKEKIALLTDDFLYLQVNEIETKKIKPQYTSSFALVSVLYEKGYISFDAYLNYFSYLSSYRCRFLPISTLDLNKAVFGDGVMSIFDPRKLQLFNFSLTLSTEYGVSFSVSMKFIAEFLVKVLMDDSVLPEMSQDIFIEIVDQFPTDMDKRSFANFLLQLCVRIINNIQKRIVLSFKIQEKINYIERKIDTYFEPNLITPTVLKEI